MAVPTPYNKTSFTHGETSFDNFPEAPHVGTIATGAALEDLETGAPVALADLWRRQVVVMEFGSFS